MTISRESKIEVDFVVDNKIAIEAKGTETVTSSHLKGLRALGEDFPDMQKIVVSMEPRPREVDGIRILPLDEFLKDLWSGSLGI